MAFRIIGLHLLWWGTTGKVVMGLMHTFGEKVVEIVNGRI